MRMAAHSPQGAARKGRDMMGAKILLGVACMFSLTAGGLATWGVQQPAETFVGDNTWIPLGLAVTVFAVGGGAIWKAFSYLSERDSRMDSFERRLTRFDERLDRFDGRQDRIMALLIGTEDTSTGVRSGGLVDDVQAIRKMVENGKA